MERFVFIIGYGNKYKVSSTGFVYTLINDKYQLLAFSKSKFGYLKVNLFLNGNRTTHLIHRLVAIHFIPNSDNKPCVNHKDGNKSNNSVDNLEWVTIAENNTHALETGLKVMPKWTDDQRIKFMHRVKEKGGSNCKKVIDTISGKKYISVKHAAKELGMNYQTLFAMVSGRNKNKTNIKYLTA
jgi:hypothetical protein